VTLLLALVVQVLHLLSMLAAAPLALGLSKSVAARLAGRAAASPIQPWRDLWRLLRKQAVFAESASGLFENAPAVAFAATVLAAAMVPSFALGMPAAAMGDLVAIAGLLMLARTTLALAAMDSGTAGGGLGASRAMARASVTEPALLLAIFPLALLAGTTNLDTMAGVLREGAVGLKMPLLLAFAALALVAFSRLRPAISAASPFAEMAATEDALAREYSGRPLGLLVWGDALRRLLWLSLLADVAVPVGLANAAGNPLWWVAGAAIWAVKISVLTVAVAIWHAALPDRAERWVGMLGAAALLGLLATAFLVVEGVGQ
jgi:formate hydrogenlyase subunit 4